MTIVNGFLLGSGSAWKYPFFSHLAYSRSSTSFGSYLLASSLFHHLKILFLPFDIKKRPSPLIRAKAAVPPYDYTLPAVTWHLRS